MTALIIEHSIEVFEYIIDRILARIFEHVQQRWARDGRPARGQAVPSTAATR
jgi:hypothetical protein